MKLQAFEKIKLTENIYGYALTEVNIPIQEVITRRISNITPYSTYDVKVEGGEVKKNYQKIKLWKFKESKRNEFIGFVSFTELSDFVNFMLENYIVCNDGSEFDKLFTQHKETVLKEKLYEFILGKKKERSYKMFEKKSLCIGKDVFDYEYYGKLDPLPFGEDLYYFTSSSDFQILYSPLEMEISKARLKINKFITLMFGIDTNNVIVWDGKKYYVHSYDLNREMEKFIEDFKDLLSEFDKNGRAEDSPLADISNINQFFKATHIVRIPSIFEVKELNITELSKRKVPIKIPIFLFNEFTPISIDKDVVVIDDPKEVIPILSRSHYHLRRGREYWTYIPEDEPEVLDINDFDETEHFLIGCKLKKFIK